jgi:hypothetical protein
LALFALAPATACDRERRIPRESDWVERGMALDTGWPKGEAWDSFIEGFHPSGVLERDGALYLYYGGSDQYIARIDNVGPANRSIGAATSPDGLRWTKYSGNPVLHFGATGNPEEGTPAAGFAVREDGDVVSYYAAGDSESLLSNNVHFDVRLATSSDGLSFVDRGQVIGYDDPSVFQSGDELFPIAAFQTDAGWYFYYHAGGEHNALSYARGPTPESITETGPVLQPNGSRFKVWGAMSRVRLEDQTYAIFTRTKRTPRRIQVRLSDVSDPTRVSYPIATYDFEENSVFFLDERRRTWFSYYHEWRAVFVRTAPFGEPDATPPGAPRELDARAEGADRVRLSWQEAVEPDTGILEYAIERNGRTIGRTRERGYIDTGLRARRRYDYSVTAINLHGAIGPAATTAATTLPDERPPRVVGVRSDGSETAVSIAFDEPLDEASVSSASYEISAGVSVVSAELARDGRTVRLTTTPQRPDAHYEIRIRGIVDRAAPPNAGGGSATYTASSTPGLVAYWRFDDSEGSIARDSAGSGLDAELRGEATRTTGRIDGGVRFDGRSGYARVLDSAKLVDAFRWSVTLTAWVRPLSVPPHTDLSNRLYGILRGPNLQLVYRDDRAFVVRARTARGHREIATVSRFDPDRWHHVAVVRDDERLRVSIFVDGALDAGFPDVLPGKPFDILASWPQGGAHASHVRHGNQFAIGASDPGISIESWFAHAAIDEVRVYARALDASEILAIARFGSGDRR